MKKVKAKEMTKQVCRRAIDRFAEKRRKEKEYWDKKMEEGASKTLLNYKQLKFPESN